jgi:hypothetical protein
MNEIVKKIANILYINVQNVNTSDLLTGKTGIAIFFYHYSQYSKIEAYNEFSDYLLDQIIGNLEQMNASNLIDFGWSIEYLIRNKFIEGDPDEILEDIDKRIMFFAKYFEDTDNEKILFFHLYLLFRIKKDKIDEQSMKYCEILLDVTNKIFVKTNNYCLSYLNSILFCFLEIHNISLYNFCEDDKQVVSAKLLPAIFHSISNNNYDQNDLVTLLEFMRQYHFFQEEKLKQMILKNLDLSKQTDIEYIIKRTWQNLLYFDNSKYEEVDLKIVNSFLEKISFDTHVENLTVNKGLAGLGLVLIGNSLANIKALSDE